MRYVDPDPELSKSELFKEFLAEVAKLYGPVVADKVRAATGENDDSTVWFNRLHEIRRS